MNLQQLLPQNDRLINRGISTVAMVSQLAILSAYTHTHPNPNPNPNTAKE